MPALVFPTHPTRLNYTVTPWTDTNGEQWLFEILPANSGRWSVFNQGGGGGVTDHGFLTGLADDDHPQYAKSDGTRGAFAAPLGTDDNYVTDAEKVKLANTSGVNTGDQTSVTGNAGTVTTINGRITQGTNVTITGSGTAASPYNIAAAGGGAAAAGTLTGTTLAANVVTSSLTSFGAGIALGTPASGTLTNCTFPTLNQSTTGNAATATALANSRTIGGSAFTGAANVTSFPSPGPIGGTTPGAIAATTGAFSGLVAASGGLTTGAVQYGATGTVNLTSAESGVLLLRSGGLYTFILPTGAAGLCYRFKSQSTFTLTVKTGTTEQIRNKELITIATTGILTTTKRDDVVIAWDGTHWQVIGDINGTWLVDGVAPASTVGGALTVNGAATLNGNVAIGDATTDLVGFYGAAAIVRGATVAAPTGGAVQDAESRTAINAIIARLVAIGIIAP